MEVTKLGPDIVKEVTQEEVTHDKLGGAPIHTGKSGSHLFLEILNSSRSC